MKRAADGRIWRTTYLPKHDTYTIPNALCPVCFKQVFFYQSPYGGRVFFDELGPPWPKHPCTDNPRHQRGTQPISPGFGIKRAQTPAWEVEGWQVVYNVQRHQADGHTIIKGNLLKTAKPVSFGFAGEIAISLDSPAFCRKMDAPTGEWEFAFVAVDYATGTLRDERVTVFPDCSGSKDVERWKQALNGDGEAQNGLGFAFSFARNLRKFPKLNRFPGNCEWDIAEYWFRLAANAGEWTGSNNLGVMYLKGYGVEQDERMAFDLFTKAANSLDPIPLKHLADCYEKGIGTEVDLEMAEYLKELAEPEDADDEADEDDEASETPP